MWDVVCLVTDKVLPLLACSVPLFLRLTFVMSTFKIPKCSVFIFDFLRLDNVKFLWYYLVRV